LYGLHRNGKKFPIAISLSYFHLEGHLYGVKDERGIPIATLSSGTDITEKRAAEKAVMHALIEGQEAERQRIAKELHDGLGQSLTAIRLNLNTLDADFEKFNQQSKEGFERVKSIVGSATQDVKTISRNLMPSVLQDYGLVKALEYLCQTINDTQQVRVHLQTHHIDPLLDFSIATGLYRIAQELLNNMLKYAQAKEVQIQLLGHEKSVVLMVEDDGVGFNIEKVEKGLGLKNIDARIKALGGSLLIDTQPGQGTSVTVEIPWNKS
jgi:signal transduction histidine kinase